MVLAYTCCKTAVKHALIIQKVKNEISLNPTDMSEEVVWAAGGLSAKKRTSSFLFSIFLQTILHTTHFSVRYSFALEFGHPRQQPFCVCPPQTHTRLAGPFWCVLPLITPHEYWLSGLCSPPQTAFRVLLFVDPIPTTYLTVPYST